MKQSAKNGAYSQTLPFLLFLVVLTVLNVAVFYGTRRANPVFCSTDSMLEALAMYVAHNGEFPVDKYLSGDCTSGADSAKKELRDSVTRLVGDCYAMSERVQHRKLKYPLITLFTTHASHSHTDKEKYLVHNNTLVNWASFKPMVKVMLFTNDTAWVTIAKERGWDAIAIAEKGTPPLLRDMFEFAKARHDTPWYGYVNADILFTRTFMETLETVAQKYNASGERVLLTGRRINMENLSAIDVTSQSSLRKAVKKFGKLYREDAEDYFIATKVFPWRHLLPVVVGIPGYDNWLVAAARCRLNATVIDVTGTLEALHQTTKNGGNREGHSHARVSFNYDVFKKANVTPNFIAGLTDCAEYRTYRSFCDTVEISKRTNLGPNCKCKKG